MAERKYSEEDLLEGTVLLIDKYLDWTSFDVVNKIRYQIKSKKNISKIKVGHAGTLDPKATGLLIVCTGKKTKAIDEFAQLEKEYFATFKLGETTASFDSETEPDKYFPTNHISEELIRTVAETFIGHQAQIPPVFSAKKVDGKRAYINAREGKSIEMKPTQIEIKQMELIDFRFPNVQFRILSSKGTYIRAIARDFGNALKSGAYLTELRRSKIGKFTVADAITVDEFQKLL